MLIYGRLPPGKDPRSTPLVRLKALLNEAFGNTAQTQCDLARQDPELDLHPFGRPFILGPTRRSGVGDFKCVGCDGLMAR